VREVCASKFRNAGQTCVCVNRIYVHESVVGEFTDRLAQAVRTIKSGDPLDETTQIGPLVDRQGLRKVQDHVDDAIAKGARIVVGGTAGEGLYFTPTVLSDVRPGMKILEEETFGPVAPVLSFRNQAEAIELANGVPYGLAAYLWTAISAAHSAWPKRSTTESSESTTASPPWLKRPSADSRIQASDAKAASGASKNISRLSTSR